MTLTEVAVTTGLFLLVLAPVMAGLTSAQRREVSAGAAARAVSDGRTAIELIAKEARAADALTETAADEVDVWRDADDDDVADAGETVTYRLNAGSLERTVGGSTSVMIAGTDGTSDLSVTSTDAGDVLHVLLSIDADVDEPPGTTTVETEVLARNA
jgi:hypothetical protein